MADDTAKKKEESKPVELRSEKVRNIIGQIPPFLIRSGIGVIAVVVVLALAVCYFIPYYETAEGEVTILSDPASIVYTSPSDGIFNVSPDYLQDGRPAIQGDTIGYVKPLFAGVAATSETSPQEQNGRLSAFLTADSVIQIISGISGKVSVNVAHGETIAKGERLVAITPDSIAAFYGRIMLPYRFKEKIKEGQDVKVEMSGFPSREYGVLLGTVGKIYPLAVGKENRPDFSDGNRELDSGQPDKESPGKMPEEMFLKVDVALPSGLETTYRIELPFTPDMHGKAKIILSKQSLLKKIFSRK